MRIHIFVLLLLMLTHLSLFDFFQILFNIFSNNII